MLPKQTVVANDFSQVQKMQMTQEKFVWIIFESGSAPIKEEFRIDLPILLFTNRLYYTGIALPRLKPQPTAHTYLNIHSNKTTSKTTNPKGIKKLRILNPHLYNRNQRQSQLKKM